MNKDRPTISLTIENVDLNAALTEYAQENAQLRLTQKVLIRRLNEQQIELASFKKKEAKDAVHDQKEGEQVPDRQENNG